MQSEDDSTGLKRFQISADSARLRQEFNEDEREDFLSGVRRGAWIAVIFSLGGFLLDYLMFRGAESRELLTRIMGLRFTAAGLLILTLTALQWARSRRVIRMAAHVVPMIPMLVLTWVLVEIGDPGSPYYAGLNLIMVATVLMLRWPLEDALINTLFCIGGYLAVAVALWDEATKPQVGTALFFLTCTGVLSCVGSYMLNTLRFRDYCTGRILDQKARELAQALEELHENEARLLQAEKLSSLGRMSAGIVHEVNNPLNYAVTALHMLRAYADDLPEEEREDYADTVGDAEEGVGRVIKIVSDLRAFTKGDVQQMGQEVNLAGVIESARRLVSHDLRGVEFEVEVPKHLRVRGNDNQLCQVFMNFIQNASEAVRGVEEREEEPKIRVAVREEGVEGISLTITDNGCGINPEDIENIFDPFFTKRQVGEGMGLGLSICHSILKAHGARVEVKSEPGQYTEFVMHFPSFDAASAPAEDLEESVEAGASGVSTTS